MQPDAHAMQELFDAQQTACPDVTDGDSSRSDEHAIGMLESGAVLRVIEHLLEIASRSNRRPMRPARPDEASNFPATAGFKLSPPMIYIRNDTGRK
jgi:hypothetical protein